MHWIKTYAAQTSMAAILTALPFGMAMAQTAPAPEAPAAETPAPEAPAAEAPAADAPAAEASAEAAPAVDFSGAPIEVVTHAGIGGGTDITGRMAMVQAPATCGTELAIVNRTGGSGAAALAYTESRPRDGHTIMLVTQTHFLTLLQNRAGGLTADDIVPVARATDDPQVLFVGGSSEYETAEQFIEAAKAESVSFGTSLIGSVDHIAVLGLAEAAGLQEPTVVPFRGGGDVVINLVGGNIDAALSNFSEAESQVSANEVRPLMVLSAERSPLLPDVPTSTELGIDSIASTIRGFAVLEGTPDNVVAALEACLVEAMNGQFFQNYLETTGQSATSVTGAAEFDEQIDEFVEAGREALTKLGIIQ